VGEVELEGSVLVIRRIHVLFHLKARAEEKETAERVHGLFADKCPIYRSLRNSIQMTTQLDFEAVPGDG
jgi:uncharacterized OsmC-like protein